MSIKTKITLCVVGFVFLILGTIAAVLVVLDSKESDGLQINLAGRQRMLSQRMTKELLLLSQATDDEQRTLHQESLAASVNLFDTTLKALKDGGETLDGNMAPVVLPAAADAKVISKLKEGQKLWSILRPALIKVSQSNLHTLGQAEFDNAVTTLSTNNLSLLKSMNGVTGAFQEASTAKLHVLHIIQLTSAVLAIVLGVLIMFVLTRTVFRPLGFAVKLTQQISDGDLTKRAKLERRDELGTLLASVNVMADNLSNVIRGITSLGTEVAEGARDIQDSSTEAQASIVQQVDEVTKISSASEEMSASILEVADSCGSVADRARKTGEYANESAATVSQTIDTMSTLSSTINEGTRGVAELGERGREIGEIIGIINDIADQTNLLALNAAIEAARAGEHGRGFAVVADEVRKLAENTSRATGEVTESIQAIMVATKRAVAMMETGSSQVDIGVKAASAVEKSMMEILEETQSVADTIQAVYLATQEQGSVSSEVSRNVSSTLTMSKSSQQRVEQAALVAKRLTDKITSLMAELRKFELPAEKGMTGHIGRTS